MPELPTLMFIDINRVIFHEKHDAQRTSPLIERIRESGFFRNPPVITPLPEQPDTYMLLDGANRVTALREMGFPHVLAQVVPSDSPGLILENWNHVVWDLEPKDLLTGIRDLPDLNVLTLDNPDLVPDLWGDCGLALIALPGGRMFTLCTDEQELVCRVNLLNAIVDSYRSRASIDRTSTRDIHSLGNAYPNLAGLIIFPQFEIKHVLALASAGFLLPTGITRFTIAPRALHINYPLFELAADKSLEEKNAALRTWIQRRIAKKGVRYYAEPTFLYDE